MTVLHHFQDAFSPGSYPINTITCILQQTGGIFRKGPVHVDQTIGQGIEVLQSTVLQCHPDLSTSLYVDRGGKVWVALKNGGLQYFDPLTDSLVDMYWPFSEYPTCLLQDTRDGIYWVGTWGKGILKMVQNSHDGTWTYETQDATSLQVGREQRKIMAMALDPGRSFLWVVSKEDVHGYVRSDEGRLVAHSLEQVLPPGIKAMQDIMVDRLGQVWVAGSHPTSFVLTYLDRDFSPVP